MERATPKPEDNTMNRIRVQNYVKNMQQKGKKWKIVPHEKTITFKQVRGHIFPLSDLHNVILLIKEGQNIIFRVQHRDTGRLRTQNIAYHKMMKALNINDTLNDVTIKDIWRNSLEEVKRARMILLGINNKGYYHETQYDALMYRKELIQSRIEQLRHTGDDYFLKELREVLNQIDLHITNHVPVWSPRKF